MEKERTVDTALRLAEQRGWNQNELASKLGATAAQLSNWKKRGMPATFDAAAAKAFRMTVDEFHAGGQNVSNAQTEAQPVILGKFTVPQTISWEDLHDMDDLPDYFTVVMPNSSLAGYVDRGTSLIFARDLAPMPGKVVLAQDEDSSEVRVGVYVVFGSDHWQLQPKAHGHPSWDSKIHNIKVLATLKWRED